MECDHKYVRVHWQYPERGLVCRKCGHLETEEERDARCARLLAVLGGFRLKLARESKMNGLGV